MKIVLNLVENQLKGTIPQEWNKIISMTNFRWFRSNNQLTDIKFI